MQPTLLILAAGMGSRYGGLKQVDPVGPSGETLMDYAVFDALRAGFARVVFVIRRDFEEAFRAQVAARYAGHVPVDFAFQRMDDLPAGCQPPAERVKPWGTAHAIRAAREVIAEPFAAINADDFYGREAYVHLAEFLCPAGGRAPAAGAREQLAMVGFRLCQTLSEHGRVARGVCEVGADGRLLSVTEHTGIEETVAGIVSHEGERVVATLDPETIVSMNMWGFPAAMMPLLDARFGAWFERNAAQLKAECYIPSVVNELVQEGRAEVRVLPTRGRWFGVTYREDRARTVAAIAELVAAGVYPSRLW